LHKTWKIYHTQGRRQEYEFSDVEGGQSKGLPKKFLQNKKFTKGFNHVEVVQALLVTLPPPLTTQASFYHDTINMITDEKVNVPLYQADMQCTTSSQQDHEGKFSSPTMYI
jgi:hypothetical protein